MVKRSRRMKKVTTKPVGKAIQRAIKQFKALRATATPRNRKRIDLKVRTLNSCYASLKRDCKDIWTLTL